MSYLGTVHETWLVSKPHEIQFPYTVLLMGRIRYSQSVMVRSQTAVKTAARQDTSPRPKLLKPRANQSEQTLDRVEHSYRACSDLSCHFLPVNAATASATERERYTVARAGSASSPEEPANSSIGTLFSGPMYQSSI